MQTGELLAKGFLDDGQGGFFKPRVRNRTVPDNRNPRTDPKLERDPRHGAMGPIQVQGRIGERFLVRVTSFRKRLLDEDNLCEKFHVDLCRYAGALLGDEAGRTKIEVAQQKVGSKERESVRIEIFRSVLA